MSHERKFVQMPSVGRIVMYTNLGDAEGWYPPEQHAAIITRVLTHYPAREKIPAVSLAIIYQTGLFFMHEVPYSEEFQRGHWTWPPNAPIMEVTE